MARTITTLCALTLCAWTAGCQTTAADIDPLPLAGTCICAGDADSPACPKTHCGVRIVVDNATCNGKVEKVEVIVQDTVEQHVWKVGEPRLSCRAIPLGSKAIIYARADSPWKWESGELACHEDLAGAAIEHVLECKTN